MKSGKKIFITGATSGIGKACARTFALNGYNLILSGRREDRLNALKKELEEKYGILVLNLVLDVTKKNDVVKSINNLPEQWKKIDVLVNNAGLAAGRDDFQNGNYDDWEAMIDTNIKGLLYVGKEVANLMIENKTGHIINIGSIASHQVYSKGNVYCGTKHAVKAISHGMRIDLLKHGIKVSMVAPGAVDTEFSMVRLKGDKAAADKVYEGYRPLYGEDIAEVVYWIASTPKHLNINDVTVMCTDQADVFYVNKKENEN